MNFLKKMGILIIVLLCSLNSNADPVNKESGSFLKLCTEAWMKKATDPQNVDYKNFGEKYCACASNLPLANDQEIQSAIRLCMSRTLLHDSMDSLEEDIGLSEIKDNEIIEYCNNRWSLIYPNQSEDDKKATQAYCDCAKPDLSNLVKTADSLTDKEYSDRVDQIADKCAGNAIADKPVAN